MTLNLTKQPSPYTISLTESISSVIALTVSISSVIGRYQGLQAKLNYHQMQQDGLTANVNDGGNGSGSGSGSSAGGSTNNTIPGVGRGKVVKDVLSSGLTMRFDHDDEQGSNGAVIAAAVNVTIVVVRCGIYITLQYHISHPLTHTNYYIYSNSSSYIHTSPVTLYSAICHRKRIR